MNDATEKVIDSVPSIASEEPKAISTFLPEPTKMVLDTQDRCLKMIEAAIENGGTLEQVEKIIELQGVLEERQAKKAFFQSFADFQCYVPTIEKKGFAGFKTRDGGETQYNFARLEDIKKAIQSPLGMNGLSYRWDEKSVSGDISVTCILSHKDGYQQTSTMTSGSDKTGSKNNIQAIASTMTYLRRYTLIAVAGLTVGDQDFDGEQPVDMNMLSAQDYARLVTIISNIGMSEKALETFLMDYGITLENYRSSQFSVQQLGFLLTKLETRTPIAKCIDYVMNGDLKEAAIEYNKLDFENENYDAYNWVGAGKGNVTKAKFKELISDGQELLISDSSPI